MNVIPDTGWLIERADSNTARPMYFTGVINGGASEWTYENLKAVRFARREDAARMNVGIDVRIAEHAWS